MPCRKRLSLQAVIPARGNWNQALKKQFGQNSTTDQWMRGEKDMDKVNQNLEE
jgi:hypothetical protein